MKRLSYPLPLENREVPLYFKRALLREAPFLKETLSSVGNRFMIISDDRVAPLVAEPLAALLTHIGFEVHLSTFPAGESSKTRATKEHLEDLLFEKGFGKQGALLAVGGGVTTDLTGFVAATFCRGIPWVALPTSLLAMTDAALGGKTAVNTPRGKNLIGILHHPHAVLIDPEVLSTLPQKEYKEGLAECLKHAALLDEPLFKLFETESEAILNRESSLVERLIFESCRIKVSVLAEDVHEKGKRRILNFGHTLGHALEALTDYTLSHGEAVALGMRLESELFVQNGLMEESSFLRLARTLKRYGFAETPPLFSLQAWQERLACDKKALNALPRFVGLKCLGEPLSFKGEWCTEIPPEKLAKEIRIFSDLKPAQDF